jgi:predicted MFS family arabinose efflux permease
MFFIRSTRAIKMRKILDYFTEDDPVVLLYFLAWFLMGFYISTFLVYGPLYLPVMGYKEVEGVSFLVGIPALGAMIGQNIWGTICLQKDRFRFLLLLSMFTFIPLWLILSVSISWKVLFGWLTIHGILLGALFPSSQTLVTLLKSGNKAEVLSKLYAWESLGWGVNSFLVGGALHYMGGGEEAYRYIFRALGICSILGFAFFWFKFPFTIRNLKWDDIKSKGIEGYKRILGRKDFVLLMIFILIVSCGSSFFFYFFSRFFKEVIHGSEWLIGVSLSLATVFGTIAYPIAGKVVERKGERSVLWLAWIGYMGIAAILSVVTDALTFAILYTVPLYPLLTISSNALVAHRTQEKDRGIAFGIIDTVFHLSSVVAPLIGALVFTRFSLDYLPQITLLITAPGIFFLLLLNRFLGKGSQ